jgi:hypothetical protein
MPRATRRSSATPRCPLYRPSNAHGRHTDRDALLQAFLDAFNARDLDAMMSCFSEDCVLDMPRGSAPGGGQRMVGLAQVREGLKSRLDGIPDLHYYGDDRHWVCGDRGVSE